MRSLLTFFRYELAMHLRSWRFWLGLVALAALAIPWPILLASERDPSRLDALASGFLRSTLRTLATVYVPLLVLITTETVGRLRTTGVQPLVFTKPFSILTYVAASWLATVALGMVLISGAAALRVLLVRNAFGLDVHLAAAGWLLLTVALPATATIVGLVLWLRTVFSHSIGAYVASAVLIWLLIAVTEIYSLPLAGWNRELIAPFLGEYIPSIGRDPDWTVLGPALLYPALLSLLLLALSCYHMRRREPQRLVLGSYGRRWSDFPTFRNFVADLHIDRGVGAMVHLLALGTLAAIVAVGGWSATRHRTHDRWLQQQAIDLRETFPREAPPVEGLWLRHYSGTIDVASNKSVDCDLAVEIENSTGTAVRRFAFALPFGLDSIQIETQTGESLPVRRWGNIRLVDLPTSLTAGSTTTLRIAYRGRPQALSIGGLVPFKNRWQVQELNLDSLGLSLADRYIRINRQLLPAAVQIQPGRNGMHPVPTAHPFTADFGFALSRDLRPAAPYGRIVRSEAPPARWRFALDWPREDFLLLAGPFVRIDRQYGPMELAIHCLRSDRDILEFALFELNEQIERYGLLLGTPGERPYSLVEVPTGPQGHQNVVQQVQLQAGAAGPGVSGRRAAPSSQAVLHRAELQRLRRYRPLFEERERAGLEAFARFQMEFSMALLRSILDEMFHPVTAIAPLEDSLFVYLRTAVATSEIGPGSVANPDIFEVRRSGWDSYLNTVQVGLYDRPLIERMAEPDFPVDGAKHIWRMLHYLMGDEKFAAFLRTLMQQYADRLLSLEDLRRTAEQIQGESLDWFFQHWVRGAGVPEYRIAEAQATMVENVETREIEYDVLLRVANRGRGRMPVPVVLITERDVIERRVWLDTRSTETLELRVPDRPEMVFVDPRGWIEQVGFYDPETGARGLVRKKIRIFE